MKIIDVSRNLQESPVYKGDEPPEISQIKSVYKPKDLYSLSKIAMSSHSGTHADAFSHFLKFSKSIDEMDLNLFYGKALVKTFKEGLIGAKDVENFNSSGERLVIRGQGKSFLSKEAAQVLAGKKIKLAATDALSIAGKDNEAEVHKILFGAGIAVIENLDLSNAADGEYKIAAFPIKIKNCDGAPVRAVLIDDK